MRCGWLVGIMGSMIAGSVWAASCEDLPPMRLKSPPPSIQMPQTETATPPNSAEAPNMPNDPAGISPQSGEPSLPEGGTSAAPESGPPHPEGATSAQTMEATPNAEPSTETALEASAPKPLPPPVVEPRWTTEALRKFSVQNIYTGMKLAELQALKPGLSIDKKSEQGILYEYQATYDELDEHFLFIFTADQQLYKLIYSKQLRTAVGENDMLNKLRQRYGRPRQVLHKAANLLFEACWGECGIIRGGILCHTAQSEREFSYFTASLDNTGTRFSLVLHDSSLYRMNEKRVKQSQQLLKQLPVKQELERLDL